MVTPSPFGPRAARLTFTLRLQLSPFGSSTPSGLNSHVSMARVRLNRHALRIAAWHKPNCSLARGAPFPSSILHIQRHSPTIRCQQFISSLKTTAATKQETMNESLLNMDIDAAEKHAKDWFGDHASWSHEQLLNLVYGTTPSKTS